jgi:TRAP-type C4-dicarboxylate transport system, periplasmic component
MGFRTITIPYSDVYQSMQTGVCDAVIGYPVAAAYTILGDVLKYWYHTNYSMEYLAIMVSDKSWKKLTPADQKVFEEVAKKYTLLSIDNAKAEDNKYMDLMRKRASKSSSTAKLNLSRSKKHASQHGQNLAKRGMTEELMKEFVKEPR